jgi:hypothetical protein
MVVFFVRERETKNTVRYQEDSKDGWQRIGTLYIQKAAVAQHGLKDRICVVVRPAEFAEKEA